jgi:hypothetical protein
MYIDKNGNIVKKKASTSAPRRSNARRTGTIRTLGQSGGGNEGTWGSGSSTAQGFERRNDVASSSGRNHNNGGGIFASVERMLGITGRTVTLPGLGRPVRLVYLLFVALIGVIFGWKAILGIAVLYFIQQRSNSNNNQQQQPQS